NVRIASQPGNERIAKCLNFFIQLSEAWNEAKLTNLPAVAPQVERWMKFNAGISNSWYAWTFNRDRLQIELVVDLDTEESKKLFQTIKSNKTGIEKQMEDQELYLEEKERGWKVYVARNADIMLLSEAQYPEIIEWCIRTMNAFTSVLEKHTEHMDRL